MRLENLIKKGESNRVEFKETYRFNIETNSKDKSLKNEVSKAICGMLNSNGGTILIGVADDRTIMGIERDLDLYGKGTESSKIDKLLIDLNDHITSSIKIESKQFLVINVIKIDGKTLILIVVEPSINPFFHSKDESFYVRDGPRTIKLAGKSMGEYISTRSNKFKTQEKLWQKNLDSISSEFRIWVENKLEKNLALKVNIERFDNLIYDYIFGCIVPHTLSDNLIDFKSKSIKNYIDNFSIIKRSQTVKTPEYACQHEPSIGEIILIYPNGLIYFCLNYSYVNPETPTFSLGYLDSRPIEILSVSGQQVKYNAPFSTITLGKLDSLLEVICFLFHPDCKVDLFPSHGGFQAIKSI
jgi:hypothetical protein